jgi:hypothetical protein
MPPTSPPSCPISSWRRHNAAALLLAAPLRGALADVSGQEENLKKSYKNMAVRGGITSAGSAAHPDQLINVIAFC